MTGLPNGNNLHDKNDGFVWQSFDQKRNDYGNWKGSVAKIIFLVESQKLIQIMLLSKDLSPT